MPNRGESGAPRLRAADRVYEGIRRDIHERRLKPGERITEELLAERFGASRTPVRAALVKLAADGFVEMTPRSGSIVKERSAKEIADVYDVRALLESAAAGLAAERRTGSDLAELKRLQKEMTRTFEAGAFGTGGFEAGGAIAALSGLNKAFHERILHASRNAVLADSAFRLMDIGFLTNTYTNLSADGIGRSLREHDKLVTAIETRDVRWAEALMRSHILETRNSLSASDERDERDER